MTYCSSAPATLMLFGEHAVLHGKKALCCAVDKRIRVTLTPRQDREIRLSSHLGQYKLSLDHFNIGAPFKFVLSAIDHYRAQFPSGFDLSIASEFSSSVGLGSSSAVTVATLGALSQWLGLHITPLELFSVAKHTIISVQGIGSGADAAAAVFGGTVAYRMEPLEIQNFDQSFAITLIYSGAKVPTRKVIHFVHQRKKANPGYYEQLFNEIESCVEDAIIALREQNWNALGQLMNQHQILQEKLGVSTSLLNELIQDLGQQPSILGAKISGSGLGDCIIGLGQLEENVFPRTMNQQEKGVRQIPVHISTKGLCHEKN